MSWPSGVTPSISLDKSEKRIESPRPRAPFVSETDTTVESFNPIEEAITERTKPVIGPEAPISISAFLVTMGDLIFMKAPNVPINDGAGIKYGSVAWVW